MKHKHTLLILQVILTIVLQSMLTVAGTVSAKNIKEPSPSIDEIKTLWNTATSATKHKAALLQNLWMTDEKMLKAKKDLASASRKRNDLRFRIINHRTYIEEISRQVQRLESMNTANSLQIQVESGALRTIAGYLVRRQIVVADISVVTSLLRDHTVSALLVAKHLAQGHIERMAQLQQDQQHLRLTMERLTVVRHVLEEELVGLENEHRSMVKIVSKTAVLIDTSWQTKELTESELKSVATEAAEASARVHELQATIGTVGATITSEKRKAKEVELEAHKKIRDDIAMNIQLLKQEDADYRDAQIALREAEEAMDASKNTDKKLYRKIVEKEQELATKKDVLERGIFSDTGRKEDEVLLTLREKEVLKKEIRILLIQIEQMTKGATSDAARIFAEARERMNIAESIHASVEARLLTKETARAETEAKINQLIAQMNDAEAWTIGLPPVFVWPVDGQVSAGYLDEEYQHVFHIPHKGIDLVVNPLTKVRSVADGIVYALKDGGKTGYSYVIIAHADGYSSLYGHISKALVSKGDLVEAGQTIALSGGVPGTAGAGHMTTGAHVHLEILKDGSHLDPLLALPPR